MFNFQKLLFLFVLLVLGACSRSDLYQQQISSTIPASIIPYEQEKPLYDNLMTDSAFSRNVKVAMLLPLTGKDAKIGEDLRNAGMMAQFDIANNNFILQFYDTQGTAEGAKKAFEQAAKSKVDLILGPVFAREVGAIRRQARAKKIPVVSFTSDTDEVDEGVYTLALLVSEQIERSVRYACEKGKQSLAIMAPDNKAGDIAIASAEKATQACGMRISAISVYNPTFINFEPYVLKTLPESFKDIKILEKQEKKEKTETEEEPLPITEQIDFDTLLIADDGNRLKSIASLFALYDITPREVLFIGTSTWQDPTLTLEGALAGARFSALPTEGFEKFSQRYEETYGKKPIRLASLSYDAVALASVLSQTGGITKENLTNIRGFSGTDGLFRLTPTGESERLLGISEIVSRNQFRVIQRPSVNFEQEAVRKENMERIRLQNEYVRQMKELEEQKALEEKSLDTLSDDTEQNPDAMATIPKSNY